MKQLESTKEEFIKMGKAGHDLQIAHLACELYLGAILESYYTTFVPKKMLTMVQIADLFRISPSHAHALCSAYRLSKEYNLIIYTGCGIGLLLKWRASLRTYFKRNPDEDAFFIGGSSTDSETRFTFSERVYNVMSRVINKQICHITI